ncbi:uncharacterized protein LOC105182605 isoform X2 [Harpegnathos saltator]|nr:uncharacterized protein LOC105182605 isoform X2 [Harpegnathos saltator]XP_025153316.1 uncharacterized protein LOC105182605 isoform X2 [Harpegnathos saltator]
MGTVWSIVCAMNLGLFSESSLKDVSFVNIWDAFMRKHYAAEDTDADVEASDREDTDEARSTSNNTSAAFWPFLQAARSTLKKTARKRGKRKRSRWTIKRQKKPLDAMVPHRRIHDSLALKSATKRRVVAAAASSVSPVSRKIHSIESHVGSNRPAAGLPGYSYSFKQLHARLAGAGGDKMEEPRGRSSAAYLAASNEDDARATPRESTTETPTDHSASRHVAGSRTSLRGARKSKRDLSDPLEFNDYYRKVTRVNVDMGDIWEDTSSSSDGNNEDEDYVVDDDDDDDDNDDDDDKNKDKDYKVAGRFTSRVNPKETELANGSVSGRKAASTHDENERLPSQKRNREQLLESLKEQPATSPKNGEIMTRRQKRRRQSAASDDNASQITPIAHRSSRQRSVATQVAAVPEVDGNVENARKRCESRRSHNSAPTSCSCKENLKHTATAIMKDIRAHIGNEDSDKDTENNVVEVIEVKVESRDVSMKYEWEDDWDDDDDDATGNEDSSRRSSDRSQSPAKPFLKTYGNTSQKGGKKRQLCKTSIDYEHVDLKETTYQSVLPECVVLDDSRPSTPSLKINVDNEIKWASEDSDISALIVSIVDEDDAAANTSTTATTPGKTDVDDDPADGRARQERNALMASACYVYRETPPDILVEAAASISVMRAPRAKFANRRADTKDVITYGNRNRSNGKSSLPERSFCRQKSQDPAKIEVKSLNNSNKDDETDSENEKKYTLRRRLTRSSLNTTKENNVGKLIWGNCSGWWPALIVEAEQVGMAAEPGKEWVYWIGESQISLLNEKTQIEPFSRKLEERLTQKFRKNNIRSQAIDDTIKMLRQRYESTLTKPYYYWIQRNIREEELDNLYFYPYPTKIQGRLDALKAKNAKATEQYILNQRSGSPEPKKQAEKTEKTKDTKAVKQMEEERLPLREQIPGVITWAKITGHNWWPAMVIDYRDCCLKEPGFGCQWIMWYGDYTVSQVHHLAFLKFHKGIEKLREYIENTKKHVYLMGVLQASKDYCARLGCNTDNWSLDNVFKYFSDMNNIHVAYNHLQVSESNKVYDKYSNEIIKKINELKSNPNVDSQRKEDIKQSDALQRIRQGQSKLTELCLKCLKLPKDVMEDHPFFEGSLCKECSDLFKPCMFVFGNDDKCFYCTVCAATGTVVICDREDCPRVFCTACLKYLLCPKVYDKMLLEDPWECFLCRDKSTLPTEGLLRPRADWKEKFLGMFHTTSDPVFNSTNVVNNNGEKRGVRVLSLFDGLSTGLVVLLKLGIIVDVYYASEIDQNALTISSAHFGDRITYLGDVRNITKEKVKEIMPIDLLIGGSPCNDLSLVNPARLGLHNPKGTGILFFEYIRILKQLKKSNKGHHLFWLYENVASMPTEYRLEMNKHLGQEPMVIDSADFSPQHRLRLYWHNLPHDPYFPQSQRQVDVQDILTPNCNRYALVKKIRTVTTRSNSLRQGKAELKPIMMKGTSDTLWITELEEIFGFPRHYTDVKNLSATNRQRLIGKSWSVQTLAAILRPLCSCFKCNEETNENTQSDSR